MNITQIKDPKAMLAVMQNLPGNYLIVLPDSPTFTIVEVSHAYNEITHTVREDIIGKGVFEVFPEEPGDPAAEGERSLTDSFHRVIATKTAHQMDMLRYPIRLKGSDEFTERFWVVMNKPVIIDGKIAYIINSINDITESMLLKSRERYFKAFAEESPMMIWRTAGVSCIYVNQAWMQATGVTWEESLGFGHLKAVHPEDLTRQRELFLSAVTNHGSYETKYRIIDRNGETRWISMKVNPLHSGDATVEFVGNMIDITDQEIAHQKIKQSEMMFRQLADSIIQMVWVTDADGMHEYYNQRWYDFTGTSFEETEGEGWNHVFHPDDQQRAWNVWRHSLQTGTPYEIEYRLKKYNGEYIWVLGRAAPYYNEDGQIVKWFGTCTDINDQKLLQQQKDDFINIASHELKTPLTSLTGYIQVIERNLLKNQHIESALVKLVGACYKNVKQLNKIIADLVETNKIGLGGMAIHAIPFNLTQLALDIAGQISTETTSIKVMGETEAKVNADAGKVEQVLINLTNNALKYASESKLLIIHVEQGQQWVKLSLTDQGKGITEDKQKFLFDRYYQAESGNGKYSGMGLGLYVSANIVAAHGGEIGVESTLGEGSTFWFTLPTSPLGQ